MEQSRKDEFARLFAQCAGDYLVTPDGLERMAAYGPMRDTARSNLADILAKRERGEDITDAVLLRLLPYAESEAHRRSGAWVHVDPVIAGTLREWYQKAHITTAADWPRVAGGILALVMRCQDHPNELEPACAEFSELPFSRGSRMTMLSPILNAVNPDAYCVVNNESRAVVNYLAGTRHGPALSEYPATNDTARRVVDELTPVMREYALPTGARPHDVFDVYCYWLVAIKQFTFASEPALVAPAQMDGVIEGVRERFVGWTGFDDPRFVYHELSYKREAAAKAQEALAEATLRALLADDDYDEIVRRLETVGKSTNLLYLARPRTGDLSILYQEPLDRPAFCREIVDLLYGKDSSEDRLAAYSAWVDRQGARNQWTFPTLLLFLCHPETDMFIKPMTIRTILRTVGMDDVWRTKPDRETYSTVKRLSADLLARFAPYGATDMIDVNAVLYTLHGYEPGEVKVDETEPQPLAEPLSRIFADRDQARRAFGLIRQSLTSLGAEGPGHPCAVVNLKSVSATVQELRLTWGFWKVFGIRGPAAGEPRLTVTLLEERARELGLEPSQVLSRDPGQPQVNQYELAADALQGSPEILAAYLDTLPAVEVAFRNWRQSNRVSEDDAVLSQAVWDEAALEALLCDGLPAQKTLAEPFSRIFRDREEAEWGLGLMRTTLDRLGIKASDDQRYSLSVLPRLAPRYVRLNFGWGMLLDFRGPPSAEKRAKVAILEEYASGLEQYLSERFRMPDSNPPLSLYLVPVSALRDSEGQVMGGYLQTLDYCLERFAGYGRNQYRAAHSDTVARALYDDGLLQRLLTDGLAICDTHPLAEPFSRIFRDREEAEWGFDLLAETLGRLGISGVADQRFSVSLREASRGGRRLRCTFGRLLVLGFSGPSGGAGRVEMALREDAVGDLDAYRRSSYRMPGGEPAISTYYLPTDVARGSSAAVLTAFHAALDEIRDQVGHWRRSPYRSTHQPAIASAVFDEGARGQLLANGMPVETVDGYFSEDTFDLLTGLAAEPTQAFYHSHREEFQTSLEEPFGALLAALAERLPEALHGRLETVGDLTSPVPTSESGKGGAWPRYLGAFCALGVRRAASAQLFVDVDAQELHFGFCVGDDGEATRQRFAANVRGLREQLGVSLAEWLDEADLRYGSPEAPVASVGGWLAAHAPFPLAWVSLTPDEVLALSRDELIERIAGVFGAVAPLVLMALDEDPRRAVEEVIGFAPIRPVNDPYPLEECAAKSGYSLTTLQGWLGALDRKKQAILYGPPGTGKTHMARQLARHLIGGNDGFCEIVQFHPAYSYEDFLQGIRPTSDGDGHLTYPVVPGRFVQFCRKAAQHDGICILIIDEINRAELSRVFGELMYLLEYRTESVPLAADGTRFAIPENVRIIGTMNTADRSIALVDHALRRRFAFIALQPNYDVLRKFHAETGFPVENLITVLCKVNQEIGDPNYAVGISFFLLKDLKQHLDSIWQMEIEPYLEEYFFDKPARVAAFRWDNIRGTVMPAW